MSFPAGCRARIHACRGADGSAPYKSKRFGSLIFNVFCRRDGHWPSADGMVFCRDATDAQCASLRRKGIYLLASVLRDDVGIVPYKSEFVGLTPDAIYCFAIRYAFASSPEARSAKARYFSAARKSDMFRLCRNKITDAREARLHS